MEERKRTLSERTEQGAQPTAADVAAAPRPSGEHSTRRSLLDLPTPRSVTPINLGFSMDSSSTGNSPVPLPHQRDKGVPPVVIPGFRPDPRRPNAKAQAPAPAQSTNENVRPGRESSQASTGSSMSKIDKIDKSSSEWEVLSDAGSRLNEGEEVNVEELQKKVDKRRSNFQYLADELAALDAQIKAAEERLKRVHEQGGSAEVGGDSDVPSAQ